jgi:cell division protein FtsZ
VLLNITGPSGLGLFEVNAAAEIIHGVAHQDANIIFGTVIDDEMGDEVRVTVIAAGFDRWEGAGSGSSRSKDRDRLAAVEGGREVFGEEEDELLDGDDDFDVPSFLK